MSENRRFSTTAKKFYNALTEGRPKPSVLSMAIFLSTKPSIEKIGPEYFDYHYWKDHGWLEKDAYYYHDPETNFVKKALANIISKFIGLIM